MPIVKTREQDDYDVIPDGKTLKMRILAIESKEIPYKKDGEDKVWTPLEWTFKILEGDFEGRKVRATTDDFISSSDLNTLRPFVETCIGGPIDSDLIIDTDDFVGKTVYGLIAHRPDRKDKNKVWEEVKEIFALTSGEAAKAKADEEVPF